MANLDNLAKLILSQISSQQRAQETYPKMIVAGGRVLGRDVSTPDTVDKIQSGLSNLASSYLRIREMDKRDNFMKQVHTIMGAGTSQEEKRNAMRELILQHGGNDYGLGIKDVLFKDWKGKKEPNITSKTYLGIMGGELPVTMLPEGQLKSLSSLAVASTPTGDVITQPGATYKNGYIYNQQGQQIGEYTDEPKPFTKNIPNIMRRRAGITQKQASRKYLGIKDPDIYKIIKETLWERYISGDRSPEVLKGLGMYIQGEAVNPLLEPGTAKKSITLQVNKVYRDANGRKARFLGYKNGKPQWQILK